MDFAIQTYSLTKKFKDITAVDHLDIQVENGTIYGLIGPDGAGKTTTIRMLTSLLTPTSGTAKVEDFDIITDSEKIKNNIGYMPQKFSLYGDLTILENLEFYAEIYQIPKKVQKEKIKELLDFSNLANHSYKLADQLSGGMKQKLALACNLIHTPRHLFLDEPTIGVDPVARKELWKILLDLKEEGVTIFVSTPYMDEAEKCDEIALMNKGKIVKHGNPSKMIQDYPKEIACVFSENNYKAKDFSNGLEYVEDAYLLGEELHIIVENFEIAKKRLMDDFSKNSIEIKEIIKINPSLEDVFVYTIKNEE